MFSPDLLTRSEHSTLIIDGKLYSWGGIRPNFPLVHDSVEKKSLTSFVEAFDIPSLSWSRVSTLSIPPAAAMGYSCASINDTIYYFGGNCMPDDCYHNDLFALNTTSKEWNHVLYANEKNTPMAKSVHCMIAFKSNKEDYLLIIGGVGPLSASTYMCSHAVYRPSPSKPNLCFTDETHILCVSSSPVQWTLPEVTGMSPPPIAACSVNTLPTSNRAVLFGGVVIDDNGFHRSNDVYIITYTKNQVNYAKLDYSPLDYCPKGRCDHSSTILRANGTHHLLVVGGIDDNSNITSDCWILDIDKRNWRKIDVPDSATRRFGHSISSFPVSDNYVWIIITGGNQQYIREAKKNIYVRGPYITVIIELVYSNGEWSVTGMWNNELIANHSIRLTLLDKLREGTVSGALVPNETEQLRKKLKEEKKKNDQLKSDAKETSTGWAITRRGSLDAMETSQQSSLVIDGKLYNWGGGRPNMPSIFALRNLTSLVDVFDIPSLSWSRVPTVGIPPTAVMGYSCVSINDVIYFFGGYCQPDDSYHNSLFTLSTSSNTWNQILFHGGEVCPIKKYGHGMVSFSNDKGDYLLTIGGFGPTSTSKSSSVALYTPSPSLPTKCFTNETHILHMFSLPAQWSVPMVTGTPPTPSAFFSLDILPNTSTAIMFGGQAVDHTGLHCTNNIYLVTCTKEQVDYIKLECTGGNCPMGRSQHSSTVITADNSPYLLVMGGADDYFRTLGDSWILDIKMKTWKKIEIPGSVAFRFDHSTTNFMISDNLFWIIVRGGYRQFNTMNNATQFVTGADTTVILELVYSNGEWSVTGMWNNELIANQSIRLTLLNKLRKGIVSSSVIRRLETEQLKKDMTGTQEENEKLQSCKFHRRITVGKHQEIEELSDLLSDPATKPGSSRKRPKEESDIEFKKMKMSDDDDHDVTTQERNPYKHEPMEGPDNFKASIDVDQVESGGRDDKLEVLREVVERLKDMLIKKDEELTELNMKLKEHRNESELKDVAIQCSSIVPTTGVCKIDVGVQFNYASLETDHLQGVTTSSSKLFTVHGDQPQSLIWPGHGFELHFPANTCLPGEECDIMVDAVVGGDFVFPEGVEPVSAIYIISITSKLHMPSLLKIQHCVALDKASKHSRLNFYRALLKEPKPPYYFKRVKGGKFDISSEFGELKLPTFCAKVIGKDSANEKDGKESNSEANKKCSNLSEDGNPTQPEKSSSVDTSIMFYGHAFYWKEKFNQWQFKFIVVKHLDAFNEYVSSNLKDHSSDLKVSLYFQDQRIKLVSDESDSPVSHEKDSPTYKGWSIKPHFEPLTILFKHACSFGYEKNVSFPPTCLVTVVGDNSVPDYTGELHCPVLLRGASFGEESEIPKIFIKRTMEERDAQYPPSVSEGPSDQIHQNLASIDTVQGGGASSQPGDAKAVISCIKEVFSGDFAELMTVVENSLQEVSAELFASRLISNETKRKPSYEAIITDFLSGLAFKKTLLLIIQHCEKLFSIFYKLGGPFVDAGDSLKQSIIETVKEKLSINLSFD